jgi:hypothetical protein
MMRVEFWSGSGRYIFPILGGREPHPLTKFVLAPKQAAAITCQPFTAALNGQVCAVCVLQELSRTLDRNLSYGSAAILPFAVQHRPSHRRGTRLTIENSHSFSARGIIAQPDTVKKSSVRAFDIYSTCNIAIAMQRGPFGGRSKATASTTCQKCLKKDMFTLTLFFENILTSLYVITATNVPFPHKSDPINLDPPEHSSS